MTPQRHSSRKRFQNKAPIKASWEFLEIFKPILVEFLQNRPTNFCDFIDKAADLIYYFENAFTIFTKSGVYHEIELSISINKKNNVVKMSFSWGEYNPSITEYVLDARGAATDISETSLDIVITEIKILERVKPNRFITVHNSTGEMVQFSILFI